MPKKINPLPWLLAQLNDENLWYLYDKWKYGRRRTIIIGFNGGGHVMTRRDAVDMVERELAMRILAPL